MTKEQLVMVAWARKPSYAGIFHAFQLYGPKGSGLPELERRQAMYAVCGHDLGYRWRLLLDDKLWTDYRKAYPETFLQVFCCGRCSMVLRRRILRSLDMDWREAV